MTCSLSWAFSLFQMFEMMWGLLLNIEDLHVGNVGAALLGLTLDDLPDHVELVLNDDENLLVCH